MDLSEFRRGRGPFPWWIVVCVGIAVLVVFMIMAMVGRWAPEKCDVCDKAYFYFNWAFTGQKITKDYVVEENKNPSPAPTSFPGIPGRH